MTATISMYMPFIEQREQFIAGTRDSVLINHFQAEIDLVRSWVDAGYKPQPVALYVRDAPPPVYPTAFSVKVPEIPPPVKPLPISIKAPVNPPPLSLKESNGNFATVPDGYATDWHTVRFSNTTGERITIHVTMGAGEALPKGVDANGDVTIEPGKYVDLTFAPGSSPNFRSTKGDGSVWNQGELKFDETNHVIWGDMSYIYGANSNMRIFSQDGKHSGYLGNLFEKAPPAIRVGDFGIMAPYDRFHPSDDPNNPGSATGGPNGAKNAGAAFFYDVLKEGEGYVERGRPAEVVDYDDASTLRFTGPVAVVL